jgi:uncharacterized membrane protein
MKSKVDYMKKTILSGVVILIPVVIAIYVFSDTIHKLLKITHPIAARMGFIDSVSKPIIANILAILIILVSLFVLGFLFSSYFGKKITKWLEVNLLSRIPFYTALKGVTTQFVGFENSNFPVVEVSLYGNNNKQLGVITETLKDGRYMVYIPLSPMISMGNLHIVTKENLTILDVSFKNTIRAITDMGLESQKIYDKKK